MGKNIALACLLQVMYYFLQAFLAAAGDLAVLVCYVQGGLNKTYYIQLIRRKNVFVPLVIAKLVQLQQIKRTRCNDGFLALTTAYIAVSVCF